MCSQNTGKIAKRHTFLITITENSGFSFRRNCLSIEMTGVIKEFKERDKKNLKINFSCEPCNLSVALRSRSYLMMLLKGLVKFIHKLDQSLKEELSEIDADMTYIFPPQYP